MGRKKIEDAYNTLFEVPAKWECQKPILFGRIKSEPIACESTGVILSLYNSSIIDKSHIIDEKNGVRFYQGISLNFGKEKRALLRSFVPKGKDHDYYHKPEEDSVM